VPGLQLPVEAEWARNVYWMYAVVVQAEFGITRDQLMEQLRREGIDTRTFFCPMNLQPCLQSQPGFLSVGCPVADQLWESGLYLPSTYTLADETLLKISECVRYAPRRVREVSVV
jgi:perosamine synthetase